MAKEDRIPWTDASRLGNSQGDFRFFFTYALCMGEMRRATAREEAQRTKDRFASTLVIAASIIAAVRLARDENITRSSPRLMAVVADCVGLAKLILERVLR